MSKYIKWIILAVILVLLAGIAVMALGFWLPWHRAESTMPADGAFTIRQQEDGALVLSWPEADQADRYCVELLRPAESEEEEPRVVYRDYTADTSFQLPQIPDTLELILRVNTVVDYENLKEERLRFGETALEITTTFDIPVVTELEWSADPDAQTVSLSFRMKEGDTAQLYLKDDAGETLKTWTLEENALDITFGDGGELATPGFGGSYTITFDAFREEPGLKFYGQPSAEMTLVRDDLLGRSLTVNCTNLGDNMCQLTWNESKGEYYEVQMLNPFTGEWYAVHQVAGDGQRSYTSPHLAAYDQYTYRVVAVGGQTMEGSEYAAVSDGVSFTTIESPIFATIWPTKKLKAYSDPQKTEVVGEVTAARAYCVLEEEQGMFGVSIDGEVCYIDSNYCMINLPEYMGSLCSYEITNSYSSIYMVHEFEIPEVTAVVTAGYENVQQADGSYLVPLLYPVAKKLVVAAQDAMVQGYRLKIYDSFRPYIATREIYDLTESILDDPIPEKTFTGVSLSSLSLPSAEEDSALTYRQVMTGSGYNLSAFLAKSGSLHNLGIALDLTLEDLTTGRELQMQTSMHDLSRYSVLSRNNAAAKTLTTIMTGAGFGGLSSEWWHFQDNDCRKELSPPSVHGGVSAECWMADDFGWKYRRANGTYYEGVTVTISGTEYTFDENGYLAG